MNDICKKIKSAQLEHWVLNWL